MHIDEHIVAERLGQSKTVCLVYIVQNVVAICDLIDTGANLSVSICSEVQGLHQNSLSGLFRYEWLTQRKFLESRGIPREEEVNEEKGMKQKRWKGIGDVGKKKTIRKQKPMEKSEWERDCGT